MSTIVTRAGKGSPLTNNEVDSNFTNLNTDKVESITSADGSVVVSTSGTTRDLSVGTAANTGTLISQVRNETGATLTKGTVVYISGAAGNKALVSKALATGDTTSAQTYGVIQADIATNQNGYVVVIGTVSGLNTSAFTDGTQLYLSGSTAGTYTSTKPYAPTHLVYVGIVTYSHATQGAIQVKIQNGYEMDELHDVSAQSPTNGDTLVYNSTTGLWTKTAQSALSVASAATLTTARTINGVSFNGSANITVADSTKLPLSGGTLTGAIAFAAGQTWPTFNQSTTGNASTATTLATARNINGVSFNGSADITVADSTKLPLSGGTMTGVIGSARNDLQRVFESYNTSAGSPTQFFIEHSYGSVNIGNSRGNLNIQGSVALHAGNYNSYSPTLTGTGASGSWGISVTGSAGSVAWTGVTGKPTTLAGYGITDAASSSHVHDKLYNGAVNTGAYITLSSGNELEYFNNAGVIQPLYIQYSGVASDLRGPAGNIILQAGNYNSYSPTLTGTGASGSWGISVTGSSASTTGNAATATTLQTARNINGVSFNGSADITVADATKLPLAGGTLTGAIAFAAGQTWPTFNQSTTGNAATATTLQTARLINGVSFNGSADITVADATKLPLAGGTLTGAITFAAGQTWPTFNQSTTGSAATLTTGRTIALTGDVTYTSASFNGSANVTGTATLATSGVTAGTYTKITVDAKGRATSGTTLAAADIPDLSLEKIPDAWVKRGVRAATTANITLSAAQTIDGIAVVAGDRVLVKDQTAAAENGIYVASATAWTRSLDANTISELAGAVVNVNSGTTNGGAHFDTDLKSTDTLGTTAINFYRVLDELTIATANTANKIVLRDGSGNFSAGTITAALSGNATTATALQTGRTIALTGDVTYTSGSFNGSANVTGTATLASVGTAGTYTKVTTDAKGRVTSGTTLAAADIPSLDANKITSGTIDAARLPSYVDDVIEAANLAAFPVTGETGKIYVAIDTNKTYRWSGTAYVYITSGAVDSVAGKTGVVTLVKGDVGLGSVDNTADSAKSVSSAATLTTGRTIALTGDVTYTSGSFNGSANVTGTATLATSGVTAGTYTKVTVDAKGRVTLGASLASADLPTYTGTITSSQVTTGLGFTPYNATNPTGYITSSALSSYLPLAGGTLTGALTIGASGNTRGVYNANGDFLSFYSTEAGARIQLGRDVGAGGGAGLALGGSSYALIGTGNTAGTNLYVKLATTVGTVATSPSFQFTSSGFYVGTNLALHAGNYNSYAPTLTGTGASGTWGISVTGSSASTTGNAATATALQTARTIGGVSFNGTANINLPGVNAAGNQNTTGTAAGLTDNSSWMLSRGSVAAASVDTATANGFYTQNNVGDSQGLLVFNAGGSLGPLQMTFTYGGLMQFRGKTDSATWTAWKTVLTSANYNSYSPTLTGTGASGTWGISVTGSSASTTGNAATATALQTARTIGGVSFNGTANINLPGVNTAGNQNTTGTANNITAYTINQNLGTGNQVQFDSIITTNNGNGTNIRIGDDVWIGDANIAYAMRVQGTGDATQGYIIFGNSNTTALGRSGTGALTYGGNAVLHAGNYNTYAPTLTGTGASGTWPISITGNANTASYAIWSNVWSFSTAGAGWYRVATTGSDGRGTYNVELHCTGGSHNPSLLQICAQGDWGYDKIVYANWDGNFPANAVRITRGGGNSYLEVYFTTAVSGGQIRVNRSGFDQGITAYSGSLSTGGDTVQDTLSITSRINAASISVNGNQVIHAGNYNSYSPTLTGTGASGTWGISITGNAATVTNGLTTSNYSSYAIPLSGAVNLSGTFGLNDNKLYLRTNGDNNHYLWNAADDWEELVAYSGTGFRVASSTGTSLMTFTTGAVNAGVALQQGGNQVLHAGNVSSYALPIGGGTLTDATKIKAGHGNTRFQLHYNHDGADTTSGYAGYLTLWASEPGMSYAYTGIGGNININGNYYGRQTSGQSYGLYLRFETASGFSEFWATTGAVGSAGGQGSRVAYIDAAGNSVFSGNVTAYSDERLKKDWVALPADFIARLATVKSGTYTRVDSGARQAGSSAQDWKTLLPEVVSASNDEAQTLSLAYGNAALVSAVELAKDNVELRARIERLESLISKLIGD